MELEERNFQEIMSLNTVDLERICQLEKEEVKRKIIKARSSNRSKSASKKVTN